MTQNSQISDSLSTLVIQISDTHLCAHPDRSLRGINTRVTFSAVFELLSKYSHDSSYILATGDISHDGSQESYRYFIEKLQAFEGIYRILPGNHDLPGALKKEMNQPRFPVVDTIGNWSLIGLNSHLDGGSSGYLDPNQICLLDQALREANQRFIVVAVHHPPIPTGSKWLDDISLQNRDEFCAVLNKYNYVRAVIFGHAHQEMDLIQDGVRWLCCPSTCVQFLPNTKTPFSDLTLPGFRWLRLHSDGHVDTGIERISQWPEGNGPDRFEWC